MSAPENHCRFHQDVDKFFDELRERTLRDHPENICEYVVEAAKKVASDLKEKSCERIPDAVSPALNSRALTIVVLGASGDLAKKKTFPALFLLYCSGVLPQHVNILGYARSKFEDVEEWKRKLLASCFLQSEEYGCHADAFLKRISYMSGSYDRAEDFARLNERICRMEQSFKGSEQGGNRLFYLALPPSVFVEACKGLRQGVMQKPGQGWVRLIVEKPFGRDTETSEQLSKQLEPLFDESQLFRIDHYLGKEMVQNIIVTRFANRVFSALWNSNNIACVRINFKETIGTTGRGGYFDSIGIIRDVVQNHLTQILSLLAMEKPRSLSAEDIRDEKVHVLRQVEPVTPENCVLGQYTASADGSMPGYLDDPTVPKESRCPTFAVMRLYINNDRWHGVPFIIKAGKALEERMLGIRVQFKDEIRPFGETTQRNELFVRAQPSEAIYLRLTAKTPGLLRNTHQTELDLNYERRYDIRLPDAYESLLHEALLGSSTNFVRKDELDAAWRIYTPLLHAIDCGEVKVLPYMAGSRGPAEAEEFVTNSGYKLAKVYQCNCFTTTSSSL
ncbi:putative glucose-6-phosphate 1-dehydrogenase [Trypanosoma rangeli]|uniref:Glucose-6-phosphate 1-dehydrogenase n=1 Tax=Trypanosoma rangeli TaxID=5698 RepID=A0A3R7JXC4_TRYRA|nr:putative glucose-6-phosphate 1-dehydrogenase [Trypanosoma rangeli]RNE96965.1 putative glucose-6-phosphate 1-dehydrogenase [Trypanosoma rangeli]|eukprot:RNE96965.1 putative glucose-6-phosphate 1-dehydrogenase [Trypanosoma rangeli]